MRIKPDPGVYRMTIPGWPGGLPISITEVGATVDFGFFSLHFEWVDTGNGPILKCGVFGAIAFEEPDHVTLIFFKPDGSEVYHGDGTYAPG